MFRIFNVLKKNIKRLMGGDKLQTIDVMIHDGMTKMSLTLKRGSAGDLYVVLLISRLKTSSTAFSNLQSLISSLPLPWIYGQS
jgi:hypothetical protein